MLLNYIKFVLRPQPTHSTTTGFDNVPYFWHKLIFWTSFFTILFFVVTFVSKKLFPEWYSKLDARKRREFPSYVVCLVHHFAMVPRAWLHIYQDFLRTEAELAVIHYASVEATIAPFCLGYLLGDTICFAIPELLKGKWEYIIHHILTSWLVTASMFAPGHMMRYIPHLLICDTTNIFFNTAWLMRTSESLAKTSIVTVLELCFAFVFLIARVSNMPLAFYAIWICPTASALGYALYTLPPIACMQWYWFYKIASNIGSRLSGNKGKSKSK